MQTAYKHRGIRYFILFFLLLNAYAALSQGVQNPVPKEVTYGPNGSIQHVRYGYQEYLPVEYDTQPDKKWPLIIHMVGIGERGDGSVEELDTIAGIGIPRLIEKGRDYPFLIMSPQPTGDQSKPLSSDNPGSFDTDTVAHFIDYVINNYNVDPNRIYVTAFSSAAQKAAQYILKNPGKVTAFVPISGNMQSFNLKGTFCDLGDLPVWAFHNNIDEVIPPKGSIEFYKELNKCDPAPVYPPKLTIYTVKGNTHDAWTKTYSNAALDATGSNVDPAYDPFNMTIFDWFLQYSKDDPLVADAGGDQTIFLPENTVTLKGSGAPSSSITFQWSQIGTTPNTPTLSGQNTATLTASNLIAGNYQFELTITDSNNNTEKDIVNVFVRSFSADAGKDTTVTVPADVTLTGQAIDATEEESKAFTYQWTQIPGTEVGDTTISDEQVIINNAATTTASISLPTPGNYRFAFAITDNVGATARDTVDVIAYYTSDSLKVNAGNDVLITLPTEDTVILEGHATDPHYEIISYQWSKVDGPEVTLTDDDTANLKLTNLQKGEYLFTLTVINDNNGIATDTVKVVAGSANMQLTANAGKDTTVTLPVDTLKIVGSGSDSYNTITGYTWTQLEGPDDVVLLNTDSSTLTLTQLVKGSYTFELTVTNDNNGQATDTVQLLVKSTNDSLVANAGKDVTAMLPVEQVTFRGTASDPYNQITGYSWRQIDGEKATLSDLNADSLIVHAPIEGVYAFELTVTNDNEGSAKDTVVLTVLPAASNYSQDFENGDGGWHTVSNNSGWQLGNSTNSPDEGGNAWFTNLNGNYANNDTSYLVSPVFDFSNADSDPVISYDLWQDIDPSDTLYVSISLDGGATWTIIQKVTGSGEEDSQGWVTANHKLKGAAGNDNVVIRFGFVTDGEGTAKGAGIDNINICQSAPAIEAITDKEMLIQTPLEIPLTISNAELSEVEISAFSDNQEVIADNNIEVIRENGEAKLLINANMQGNANITVVVQERCSGSTSFAVAVVDEVTGIDDELEDATVIYPNPGEGIFYLKWKERTPKGAAVNIFNVQGGLVKSFQAGSIYGNFVIDLRAQAAGTYLVVIHAKGKARTYRLVKK